MIGFLEAGDPGTSSVQGPRKNDKMPLTPAETEFLAAYVYEYMRNEFGPSSQKLQNKGFRYSDVTFLLDAYVRTNPPRLERGRDQEEDLVFGHRADNPPEPPWPDRQTVQRRNAELLEERMKTDRHMCDSGVRMPKANILLVLPLAAGIGGFAGLAAGAAVGEWLEYLGMANAMSWGGLVGGVLGALLCPIYVFHKVTEDDRISASIARSKGHKCS